MKLRGLTLVELIVSVAIFGIVVFSILGLVSFMNTSLIRTVNQNDVQSDVQVALKQIENQVAFASGVTLYKTVPATFDANLNYIYLHNNIIYHKLANQPTAVVLSNQLDTRHQATLGFAKVGAQTAGKQEITINLGRSVTGQNFNTSAIKGLSNLPGEIVLDGGLTLGEFAPALSYTFSSNSKELLSLALEKTNNSPLSDTWPADIQGFISGNEVAIYVPFGTDRTALKPSFTITGKSLSIGGTTRTSGTFTLNMTSAQTFRVVAEDNSYKDYVVRVLQLSANPPSATNVRIKVYDQDETTIIPLAWDTSVLEGSYLYISNDNGVEQNSQYQWSISSTENGTYSIIPGANTIRLKLANYPAGTFVDKWVRFEVKARSQSGTEDSVWRVSAPKEVKKDPQNPLWKRIVMDLYFYYASATIKNQINLDRATAGQGPYQVIVRIRDEIETGSDRDTSFKVKADINANTIEMSGVKQFQGSYFAVDMQEFAPNNNVDTYKVTFKTQLAAGTYGYGVALSNNLDAVDKDYGYMLQFDPGASGFILRRHSKIQYGPEGLGVQRHTYDAASGTWIPVNPELKEQGGWSHASYRPINTQIHNWTGANTQGNPLWYNRQYVTEMTIQRQIDQSIILRVVTWPDGYPNNRSKEMWFGDFGEYYYTDVEKFVGRTPTTGAMDLTNETSLRAFTNSTGNFIGFRSWLGGGASKYTANFIDLKLEKGFEMKVNSAGFVVETNLNQTKSCNKIYIEMDQPIRENSFDKDKIQINPSLGSVQSYMRHPFKTNTAILTLDRNIAQHEYESMVGYSLNNISRGGIRHANAGDVQITNGSTFEIKGYITSLAQISLENYDRISVANRFAGKSTGQDMILKSAAENFELIPNSVINKTYFIKHVTSGLFVTHVNNNNAVAIKTLVTNDTKYQWVINKLAHGNHEIISVTNASQWLNYSGTSGSAIRTSNSTNTNRRRWVITLVN